MNAVLAFMTNPLFTQLLSLLATKFIEWEKAQSKDNFRVAIIKAIETGDQRDLDGGNPSLQSGVRVKKQ